MDYESARIQAYFSHVCSRFPSRRDVSVVVVAHMVPNSVHFVPAINGVGRVAVLLPKPKSEKRSELAQLKQRLPGVPVGQLRREWASDPAAVLKTFRQLGLGGGELAIVDIGGYFATSIDQISRKFPGRVLGVMEGTENGVQKYERSMPRRVPVMTVARSPLKLPEDYLVASSVIFSVEAVLREQSQILQTRTACVIGYGRVGRGVAAVLRGRGIPTWIHDRDPIAMAEAAAQGYQVYRRLDAALAHASLIICATGNRALDKYGFAAIRNGAVVATVTSGDDELDLNALELGYDRSTVSDHIARCDETATARYFWLVNNGDAANFIHGAVIGPAVQLIEGEKLAAISKITQGGVSVTDDTPGELTTSERRKVAEVWNEHFLAD